MFNTNKIHHDIALVRNAIQTRQYKDLAQKGAVLTIDIILWAGGVLAALAFVLWLKNSGWPSIQGMMESSAQSSQMKRINDIFTGSSGYTGLNNAAVANTSIFQSKYLPGGGVIQNRFGGTVGITFSTTRVAADTLVYTQAGVPSAACTTLANQLADDVDVMRIGGVTVKNEGDPINPILLNTQCQAARLVEVVVEKIKQS